MSDLDMNNPEKMTNYSIKTWAAYVECKVFTSEVIHHLVIWTGELIRVLSKEVWKFSNMISEREEPGWESYILRKVNKYFSIFSKMQ